MSFEQRARAGEDIEDFFLAGVHDADGGSRGAKNKINFASHRAAANVGAVLDATRLPLEDEVGDILEKAMRRLALGPEQVAARARVPAERIRDAIDYRGTFSCEELGRIAGVLELNDVGLCALAAGRYPLPELGPLPFCIWPLRAPHGVGVANAYLVAETGATRGVLFDSGADLAALESAWPKRVTQVDAVFLTHLEQEHAGGLCGVLERFGAEVAYVPAGVTVRCGAELREGESRRHGALTVTAYSTPGHAAAHNCYLIEAGAGRGGSGVLVSGDLLFAGSVGGAYFSGEQLHAHVRRMLTTLPRATVIAPGHGPLTTADNELRYNPFVR